MIAAAPVNTTLESLPLSGSNTQSSNTDEVCQNRIQHLLQGARPEFRKLQITTNRGTVTLEGRVANFYLRQLAIQCCRQAAGAFRIDDQLQVGTA